jgi:hypothetical protein
MRNWMVLVLAALAGCSAHYPGSPTQVPTLAAVQIHYIGSHSWVNPGTSVSLALYAINSDGAYESVTSRASWLSSNTAVATVSNGTARGAGAGAADIIATYQGLTATARVVVINSAVPVPWLDIRTFSVPETGRTTSATASYFVQNQSNGRDVTTEATWTSSDPSVFTVEAGRVTGRGPGTAELIATYNGVQARRYGSVPPLRALP